MCRIDPARWNLTPRETDVVTRIARGLENKEIAHDLGIGMDTVKMHLRYLRRKMHARNRTEVAILLHGGRPASLVDAPDVEHAIEQAPAWQSGRTTLPHARRTR